MAKNYVFQFGAGNPTLMTGLSPTFVVFKNVGGSAITAPGVTEIPTSTGLYYTTYGPTQAVTFLLDAGSSVSGNQRYLAGVMDPIQAVDEQFTNYVGSTASSFGNTATDPSTVFGYLKRLQEFNEGNSVFTKSSGAWDIYARGNAVGASTQLIEKTITDSSTAVTKV